MILFVRFLNNLHLFFTNRRNFNNAINFKVDKKQNRLISKWTKNKIDCLQNWTNNPQLFYKHLVLIKKRIYGNQL